MAKRVLAVALWLALSAGGPMSRLLAVEVSFVGNVLDPAGNPVGEAEVEVRPTDSSSQGTVNGKTDRTGKFSFHSVNLARFARELFESVKSECVAGWSVVGAEATTAH